MIVFLLECERYRNRSGKTDIISYSVSSRRASTDTTNFNQATSTEYIGVNIGVYDLYLKLVELGAPHEKVTV